MTLASAKRVIYICSASTIVAGAFFIALYPTKAIIDDMDRERIASAARLETAIENYAIRNTYESTSKKKFSFQKISETQNLL